MNPDLANLLRLYAPTRSAEALALDMLLPLELPPQPDEGEPHDHPPTD